MDAQVRVEFALSAREYDCLLRTMQTRFGVTFIEDLAFLSPQQIAGVSDRFEAAAVQRLYAIATTHIGVGKLFRSRGDEVREPSTHDTRTTPVQNSN